MHILKSVKICKQIVMLKLPYLEYIVTKICSNMFASFKLSKGIKETTGQRK